MSALNHTPPPPFNLRPSTTQSSTTTRRRRNSYISTATAGYFDHRFPWLLDTQDSPPIETPTPRLVDADVISYPNDTPPQHLQRLRQNIPSIIFSEFDFWAHLSTARATNVPVLVICCFAFWVSRFDDPLWILNHLQTPGWLARAQPRSLSETEIESPDGNISDQDDPPSLSSKNAVADIDPSERDTPPASSFEQDIQIVSPSEHCVADSESLEQDVPDESPIPESNDPEDDIARDGKLRVDVERLFRVTHELLTRTTGDWLHESELILMVQKLVLVNYNFLRDQTSGRASLILEILQGPVKYISGDFPVIGPPNIPLDEITKVNITIADAMEDKFVRHSRDIEAAFNVNHMGLKLMRVYISSGAPSTLGEIDSLIQSFDMSNKLILEAGTLIDTVLSDYARLIAERRDFIYGLIMVIPSDLIISLINAPSGWETLPGDKKETVVIEGSQESAQQAQGVILAHGLRQGVAAPADIVSNVFELSRTFRGSSKKLVEPTPKAEVPKASLFSLVKELFGLAKDPSQTAAADTKQHAEVMKKLRNEQGDLNKIHDKIRYLEEGRKTSRTYTEDKMKAQKSEAKVISRLLRARQLRVQNN
ncbi:hypothetical protein DHEL01_v210514 [Diaporthe helianthi]|uniref:Uncharacterized protein n=1 Tax=Diaporthe helianthi TaxID=158607 RepID=A0A2P5HLG4_DIAHE|nr:hypothetical protein DHEL01_v210514 [Diaporthe helianthi]